jgi:hypothetical protein
MLDFTAIGQFGAKRRFTKDKRFRLTKTLSAGMLAQNGGTNDGKKHSQQHKSNCRNFLVYNPLRLGIEPSVG